MNESISFPQDGNENSFQIEDRSFWYRQRNRLILFVMSKHLKPGAFADIGGGNGYVATAVQNNFPYLRTILIEPGPRGCENAKKRGMKETFNATLEQFNSIEKFDNIGIFDVLEHIENDSLFLENISRRLATGGKLFITVPAYKFLTSYDDDLAGHFRRYTLSDLKRKLKERGFEVEFGSYFFMTLIPLIFFFRTLPYLLGRQVQSDMNSDHEESVVSRLVENLIRLENKFLYKMNFLPFGASILICAKKK